MRHAAHLALRYYLALRVSAATATPAVFTLEHYDPPTPIVRTHPAAMLGRWDEREMVTDGADGYIITTSLNLRSNVRAPVILSN